ncbi:MAG: twin-arginine translocation pathway signal protein [Betaproteobacteria bacterium]|nr:twin-arginine translocation pathway signal protein [Betaproteobacteria bacterium]
MKNRRRFIQTAFSSALLGSSALQHAFGQNTLPLEQVKVLYGFPPGSSGDICARRVAEKFAGTSYSRNSGVIDSRPGAGGQIALNILKSAPSDGSVLAMTPFSAISLYPHIFKNLQYKPFEDFSPVGTASMIHHGFAIGPLVPASVKNVKDFVAWAKANPALASFASPAAGSTPHFIGALLGLNQNFEFKHVPYRGSVPGVTDVVGGQIACMFTPHGDFIANHRAGKMRIIATSGKSRSPFVPDVATFTEQGFPELTVEEWFGFYAPSKTPSQIISAANTAIQAALNDKSVQEALTIAGLIPFGGTPADQLKSSQVELERWGPLIKRIGFSVDS